MFLLPSLPRNSRPLLRRSRRSVALVALAAWALASVAGAASAASGATTVPAPAPVTETTIARSGANADSDPSSTKGFVDVIDVSGYVDPVMRDFILRSIEDAVAHKAEALVIQLNSPGALLPTAQLDALVKAIGEERRVPVTVWVGGYKARAKGGAARLVSAASVVGVASGTRIGGATPSGDGGDDQLVGRTYTGESALKAK